MPTPFAKMGDDDCCYCSKANQSIRFPPIQTSQKWNIVLPNLSNYSYLENNAACKYGHNVHKSTQNIVNCNLEPTLSLSVHFAAHIFATKSNLRMHMKVKHIFETAREQSFSTDQNFLHTL